MKVTKKAQQEFIKAKLATNPIWARRALLKIYEHQTAEEQVIGSTVEDNNIGFTGADAFILTSFAQQLISKNYLSDKQMSIVMKKMKKYSRQILEVSDQEKLIGMLA
jgi:hypothetical protein